MRASQTERKIIQYYDSNAPAWVADHSTVEKPYAEAFDYFINKLEGNRVLEIGVGGGREIPSFLEKGLDYYGIDGSHRMIAEAKKRNPHARLFTQNAHQIQFNNHMFDGIWAAAIYHHIEPDNLVQALTEFRRVKKLKGIGFISVREGESTIEDQKTGLTFYCYSLDRFTEKIIESGLTVIETRVLRWPGQNYLEFFIR